MHLLLTKCVSSFLLSEIIRISNKLLAKLIIKFTTFLSKFPFSRFANKMQQTKLTATNFVYKKMKMEMLKTPLGRFGIYSKTDCVRRRHSPLNIKTVTRHHAANVSFFLLCEQSTHSHTQSAPLMYMVFTVYT